MDQPFIPSPNHEGRLYFEMQEMRKTENNEEGGQLNIVPFTLSYVSVLLEFIFN